SSQWVTESLLPSATALGLFTHTALGLFTHVVVDLGPRLLFATEVVEQLAGLLHRLFVQPDGLIVRQLLQLAHGPHGRDDRLEDLADGLLSSPALLAIQDLLVLVQDLDLELEQLLERFAADLLLHDGSPSREQAVEQAEEIADQWPIFTHLVVAIAVLQ